MKWMRDIFLLDLPEWTFVVCYWFLPLTIKPEWNRCMKNSFMYSFLCWWKILFGLGLTYRVGVKLRNMKMDFNTGGTWRRVGQWTLMMKIYDLLYSSKLLSNNKCKNHSEDGIFFTYYYLLLDNDLAE